MLSLTETIIGFAAVMLMLSLLVKTLTSVIKNHFDYYTDNLQYEVKALLKRALGAGWAAVANNYEAWAAGINWERYDESFLTKENIQLALSEIGVAQGRLAALLGGLDTYVKLSVANVKYVFEQRMKNLSLAAGLALCLFANINAVSIWKALYTDEQLRTSFADTYARQALRAYEETTTSKDKSGGAAAGHSTAPTAPSTANTKPVDQPAELEQERLAFRGKLGKFLSDVNFGVGWFWRAPERSWKLFAYEFLGSLLTGILVSIGAPYWHDLLQAMSALRERPAKT